MDLADTAMWRNPDHFRTRFKSTARFHQYTLEEYCGVHENRSDVDFLNNAPADDVNVDGRLGLSSQQCSGMSISLSLHGTNNEEKTPLLPGRPLQLWRACDSRCTQVDIRSPLL
ncbi:hypothetical protein TcWFU_005240 [Taenia crassiceps]|uniref:Uncharacterized protein n=1 Tax=Taenia crassiceps TaxID=6207 RepID=A0ABR4Q415_9CEST